MKTPGQKIPKPISKKPTPLKAVLVRQQFIEERGNKGVVFEDNNILIKMRGGGAGAGVQKADLFRIVEQNQLFNN